MPNKYDFKRMNLEINPTNAIKNNIIEIGIDGDYKKEPVMQITGANDTQLLYYFGKILIYKYNEVKFFVVELTSEKNPNMYIVFDVTSGSKTPTDNNTGIGKLIRSFSADKKSSIEMDLNNIIKTKLKNGKKMKREGNVVYVDNITVSYSFPVTANINTTYLPESLKGFASIPSSSEGFTSLQSNIEGLETFNAVQEEIQWLLDCNLLGENGEDKVSLASDKNAYTYFVSGISIAIVLFFIYIAAINWSSILKWFSKKGSTIHRPGAGTGVIITP